MNLFKRKLALLTAQQRFDEWSVSCIIRFAVQDLKEIVHRGRRAKNKSMCTVDSAAIQFQLPVLFTGSLAGWKRTSVRMSCGEQAGGDPAEL